MGVSILPILRSAASTSIPCLSKHFAARNLHKHSRAAMATMRAVQIEAPGPISSLKLAQVAIPKPGPGQVTIKNVYAGVNYIDTYHRSGMYKVDLPFTLGVDGSGEVWELGEGVQGLAKGDPVAYLTSGGAYADYVVAEAAKVYKVPDDVGLQAAAASVVQGMTAVYLATQVYHVKAGDWVLVHAAAGGTGSLITQIAAAAGAHVIGVTSSDAKAAKAKALGAEHVLRYDQPDFVNEVHRLADGQGVHVVYDGVGAATWDLSRGALRHLGELVSFGNASGKLPAIELFSLTPRTIKVSRPSLFEGIKARPDGFQLLITTTLDLVKSGKVKLAIQEIIPLEEAARAHELLEGRGTSGKLLLKI